MRYTPITPAEIATLPDLGDWRVVGDALRAEFRAGSFPAAAALVSAIADAAEAAQHHPDLDIRYPDRVRVSLRTHATDGLTTLDVDVARTISALAATAGAASESLAPQITEIAIDTVDADRIRPFWAALLGYQAKGINLVDPRRIGPTVWFQQLDEPRPQRNRIHVDVLVPHDQAEARLAAALSAGGTLLSDRFARAWWVLADADGNEACVCTWQDR